MVNKTFGTSYNPGMNPHDARHFDLIIIGAGPAGAAAAVTACKCGLSVALIDKAKFPRDKLCGGLFTGRSRAAYQEIFDRDIDPNLFEERRRIGFFLDHQPLGPVQDFLPVYLTMRRDMDDALLKHAVTAGAADHTGQRIETLDLSARNITLQSGEILEFTALIGADGVNSLVAKTLFGRSFDPRKIGFALEIEAPAQIPPDENPTLRIDFDAAAWGYGWRFPKRASTTIGLGGLHAANPDMKAHLETYLGLLGEGRDSRVKGHFLPFGDAKRKPGQDNILLVGDAAGMVDPITGEGIAYALQSGHLAALAITKAIHANNPGKAYSLYRKSIAPIQRSIRIARALRLVIFTKRLQPFFKKSFAGSRTIKREYLRMLSGETEYSHMLWLFARRLPGAIWRALKPKS